MRKLSLALASLQIGVIALAFLAVPEVANASHFRYGQLSWQRVGGVGSMTVRFDFFGAFRRDGYNGTAPDGRPKVGDIILETIGATGLNFGDGTAGTGTLRFLILNIDPTNNWLYGVALQPGTNNQGIPHTYANGGPWIANIDTCCRIGALINAGDQPYRVETIVDLNDTTSSPTSTLPIIVQCPQNQNCNFPVPAADPDAQLLQFRMATNAESLIAPTVGLTVTPGGAAQFQTSAPVGSLYAAQIVVEKRDRLNPLNLLTKIGVDFLIQVVPFVPQGQNPSFLSPTPTCAQTINLQVGQPIQFTVSVRTNNQGGNVTLNATGQPAGSTFAPAIPLSGSPSVSSVFSFTPTPAQGGQGQAGGADIGIDDHKGLHDMPIGFGAEIR